MRIFWLVIFPYVVETYAAQFADVEDACSVAGCNLALHFGQFPPPEIFLRAAVSILVNLTVPGEKLRGVEIEVVI